LLSFVTDSWTPLQCGPRDFDPLQSKNSSRATVQIRPIGLPVKEL